MKPSCSGAQSAEQAAQQKLPAWPLGDNSAVSQGCAWLLAAPVPHPHTQAAPPGKEQAEVPGWPRGPFPAQDCGFCLFAQADKAGVSGRGPGTSKAHCSASFSWMGLELRPGLGGGCRGVGFLSVASISAWAS